MRLHRDGHLRKSNVDPVESGVYFQSQESKLQDQTRGDHCKFIDSYLAFSLIQLVVY